MDNWNTHKVIKENADLHKIAALLAKQARLQERMMARAKWGR